MMHSLLDQCQYSDNLKKFLETNGISDAQTFRDQISDLGYNLFICTDRLVWPYENNETPEDWVAKMKMNSEYGDQIFLQLTANVLNRDIIIIPVFRDQAHIQASGFSIINSASTNHQVPLFLLQFSDARFSDPHYQSIRPSSNLENIVLQYIRENRSQNNSTRTNTISAHNSFTSTTFEESSFSPSMHSSIAPEPFIPAPITQASNNNNKTKTKKRKGQVNVLSVHLNYQLGITLMMQKKPMNIHS